MKIYFSDFFRVSPQTIESYGAFNVSLINDLPLFIDPFLLFGSKNPAYQEQHELILKYLRYLKDKAHEGGISVPQIKSWYVFSEVKQNWFGYSIVGNDGRGLGLKFGRAMSSSMHVIFDDLGDEKVTQTSHLEKAALFEIGVGRDNISDFTVNLIKDFLLTYTESFTKQYIDASLTKVVKVQKVYFDYDLERWMPKEFTLPYFYNDFVILTPRDILTKDENWINSHDLRGNFERICNSIQNDQLRNEIRNYFKLQLPRPPTNKRNTEKEISLAVEQTIRKYPEIIKWYIKQKEENKENAKNVSSQKVEEVETVFIHQVTRFVELLIRESSFYSISSMDSYAESMKRVQFLKQVIENNDGYKLFYVDGKPIKRESDLQIIYRLTWYATDLDVNREVNNGRGPVDYKISKGAKNASIVEFKLASNGKLRQNLKNQVAIYESANATDKSIKVILYFDIGEYAKVKKVLKDLNLENEDSIVLIDASPKESASVVK